MDTNKKTILIVDDDDFITEAYSQKFIGAGFRVEIANDGYQALHILNQGLKPDVIILDIIMPELDGLSFLKIIKEKKLAETSKIIMHSTQGQKETVERALELGAIDFVVKADSTPSELVEKVKKLL